MDALAWILLAWLVGLPALVLALATIRNEPTVRPAPLPDHGRARPQQIPGPHARRGVHATAPDGPRARAGPGCKERSSAGS